MHSRSAQLEHRFAQIHTKNTDYVEKENQRCPSLGAQLPFPAELPIKLCYDIKSPCAISVDWPVGVNHDA
jgi:hypothetical protein